MLFILLVHLSLILAQPPQGWWLNSLGTSVNSISDFNTLLEGDKHLIIDFYM
mgnify:CR=1 FL=1